MQFNFIIRNIELVLSGVGLLVIIIVPSFLTPLGAGFWESTAAVAILVGTLHGGIFWAIRHRQRRARANAIHQIRGMLNDVVRNQLTSIALNAQLSQGHASKIERIKTAVNTIDNALEHISDEGLREWHRAYSELPNQNKAS